MRNTFDGLDLPALIRWGDQNLLGSNQALLAPRAFNVQGPEADLDSAAAADLSMMSFWATLPRGL